MTKPAKSPLLKKAKTEPERRKRWKLESLATFAVPVTRSEARANVQYLGDWALCQPELEPLKIKSARVINADVP